MENIMLLNPVDDACRNAFASQRTAIQNKNGKAFATVIASNSIKFVCDAYEID